MSLRTLTADQFLRLAKHSPIFDVRSPGEYQQGHIPGAHNLPLFSDQERHRIGLAYKHQGREQAVILAFEFVGPRLAQYIAQVKAVTDAKQILVHCWRGGMRSQALAWLLEKVGYRVGLLQGGYKAYRRHVLAGFATPLPLRVLGGMTGSGKTDILQHLRRRGQQVLDLEGLAHHRGSAFGGLEETAQPSNEQFENELHTALLSLSPAQPIWIEDESRRIGRVLIPEGLFLQMRIAPLIRVQVSREVRVERLCRDYGAVPAERLAEAVRNISKRLGGEKSRSALQAIAAGDYAAATHTLLDYYDKTYLFGISKRNPARVLDLDPTIEEPSVMARALSALMEKWTET